MWRPGAGYATDMASGENDTERPDTAADMAGALQLDPEETLTTGDPLDAGYSPPDRPYAVEDPAVTGEEETLDERLRREEPEGATGADEDRTGRLIAAGADGEALDVGVDGGAASAEEAAVHDVETGIEPVVDDSPAEDPEVAEALEEERRPRAAQRDAERDIATQLDEQSETDGVPGVAGSRDAGVTPGSWT